MFRTFVSIIALVGVVPAVHAERTPYARIKPFVDEQTLAIVRVDVADIDPAAFFTELTRRAEAALPADMDVEYRKRFLSLFEEPRESTIAWRNRFLEAGGRDVYVIYSLADAPDFEPPFLVVPFGADAKADAIGPLIAQVDAEGTKAPLTPELQPLMNVGHWAVVGDAVVAGMPEQFERLRQATPRDRPEIAEAFQAVEGLPVQAVGAVPSYVRRIFEDMLPTTLPAEVGGGETAVVTGGVLWAALGADLPPRGQAKFVLQSPDDRSAAAIGDLLARGLRMAANLEIDDIPPVAVKRLAERTRFQARGDRVVALLTTKEVNDFVDLIFSTCVQDIQHHIGSARMAEQAKTIGMALAMYRADHKGKWPDTLEGSFVKDYLGPINKTGVDAGEMVTRFVYIKPPTDEPDPRRIVIHEKFDTWPSGGVAVGCADAHVMQISDRGEFDRQMALTEKK